MCWTYISRKAVFSRVWFQVAYRVTWNSCMDLESGAVGKNKLSEKNIAQSVQWRNPCPVQHVSKCFWDHKLFTMNFYYHMVGTAKSRAHHSFASLEAKKPPWWHSCLFCALKASSHNSEGNVSKDKLEIHEKTCSYLKDPQMKDGLQPQKNTSNAGCPTTIHVTKTQWGGIFQVP